MPGSRRWFEYTSDSGILYGMQLDESTYENQVLGFGQFLSSDVRTNERYLNTSGNKSVPQPRYALLARNDGDERFTRRVYVGDPTSAFWVSGKTLVVDGQTFTVTSKIGEARRFPSPTDTGLNDGDIDDNFAAPPV